MRYNSVGPPGEIPWLVETSKVILPGDSFQTLSSIGPRWPLITAVVRSGLRPSLVQGLRPRNAPLWLATVLILPQQRV